MVRPLTRAGIALCVGLFTWTACNVGPHKTSAPSPTATPQPKIVTTRLTALLTGELVLEDNCLRVAGYLLAWPPEFTVDIREDTVEVADGLTGEQVTWRLGETVRVGGGETPDDRLTEAVRERLPANCRGPYWLVGGWLPGVWGRDARPPTPPPYRALPTLTTAPGETTS